MNWQKETYEIEEFGEHLIVECDYHPPVKSNDYDIPDDPAEIEITKVELFDGGDVTNLVLEYIPEGYERIEETIREKYRL